MNIENGRYWNLPWSLVSGCTPCSPGCDNCWSAAMTYRFAERMIRQTGEPLIDSSGRFTGCTAIHPERLDIPLKRKKPTVYAIWNDLFHEEVPVNFQAKVFGAMDFNERHTFLILTKRPGNMLKFDASLKSASSNPMWIKPLPNVYSGLTICNQQEAYDKLSDFKRVPGKKFLSLEPLLSDIPFLMLDGIDCVILGGETGPGARPTHPDWVRSIRDQCEAAGVPFFFKGWGAWKGAADFVGDKMVPGSTRKSRILDGQEWNQLPWVKE